MESSPLTLVCLTSVYVDDPTDSQQAYDHARAASVATTTDTTVAINEHALAAGEFARAASGSGNAEALRTLRLLEQHHQRLSELLRYPSENPPAATATPDPEVQDNTQKPVSTSAAVAELRASKSDLVLLHSSSPLRTPPSLQHPRRLPPRDMSSSIASNLATARGIRANYTRQPLSPSVSAQQAPGTLESLPRRDGKRSKVPASIPEYAAPSWIPPTSVSQKSEVKVSEPLIEAPAASAADEGFSKFFENILSKLSAPLAFAGLPLTVEESPAPVVTEPAAFNKRRTAKSNERTSSPDLTKYISRAALRATTQGALSGNDSFYVVPTTGGTVSYAHILSFDQKERRRLAASIHSENTEIFADPEEDDFVDARETPMPPSPATSRRSFGRSVTSRDVENKVEELEIENQSLKSCIDKLTNRLHAFEMSSQQNTFALQESMRLIRDSSPARPDIPGRGDETLKRRLTELEERVALDGREVERLTKANDRLNIVIDRYRDRWEKLKAGAKTRREGTAGKETGKDGPSKRDSDPASGRFLAG